MDEALQAAKDAIKAGGSAKYKGKVHTSLATLLGGDSEGEESSQVDLAALTADLEDARFRIKEAQQSREYWYNAHGELATELDAVRTDLERTNISLNDSDKVLKERDAENSKLKAENEKQKAEIEKLTKELAEAKKPKPAPAAPATSATPASTPTTPA